MFPPVEQMIADIAQWLPRPYGIKINHDPDSGFFVVVVGEHSWSRSSVEKAISHAWGWCDQNRKYLKSLATLPEPLQAHAPEIDKAVEELVS